MNDKTMLVKRLEKFLPTALADQVAEEVADSLWLALHDAEVRAGVVRAVNALPRYTVHDQDLAWTAVDADMLETALAETDGA